MLLRLKTIREKRGLTQTALASLVGVAQGYISSLEAGLYSPSLEVLVKLALSLNCSLDELVDVEAYSPAS